jgi:hypothetical protein
VRAPLVVVLLLLVGCASGARFAAFDVPPERAAYLTVIRSSVAPICCAIPLFVDNRQVVNLRMRQFATVTIPAGERVVSIPKGGYTFNFLTFTAAPGEHYYVVMDVSYFETDPRLYPASLAEPMLNGLHRIE